MHETLQLGFPLWVRLTHFFNLLFITLLIRSGIEIIGAHPKLYWRDDSLPGSEWFRLTKKRLPKNQLWTSEDEIEPMSRWAALPGANNLGLGRHWHFWAVNGWLDFGSTEKPILGLADLKKACEGIPAELVKAGVFKQDLYDRVVKALAEYRAKKAKG